MLCDYHVHSEYSDDSVYPMETIIEDAIQKGMKELCFTDHVDYGVKEDWINGKEVPNAVMNVHYEKYFEEIERLQKKYEGQIVIRKGLEFGIQMHTRNLFQKLVDTYPMDFIILSVHQVEDKEFWNNDFQKGRTEEEYYARYYKELYDLVHNFHSYSVLGHMDLIRRYDDKDGFPFEKNEAMIREILKQVIADGKGIEVNTSSKRYGLDDLTPSKKILEIYKELGGTILTIGSDSHKKEHLGEAIEEIKQQLKEMGFEKYCTFKNYQPIFHEL